MTRPLSDLLRDVTKALAGYGSLKHTQSKFPQHPGIQAALLEEVAYIEALEREVRAAAQAGAWVVVEAIATADPPIGAQEARIFAQKALAQAQAGAETSGEGAW